MRRASLVGKISYETSVPIFLERFILPALATVLIGVIVLNPFQFDRQQQFALAVAVVALAYFVGHTVHKLNNPPKPITPFEAAANQASKHAEELRETEKPQPPKPANESTKMAAPARIAGVPSPGLSHQVHIEQHNEGSSGTNIAAQTVNIAPQDRALNDPQRQAIRDSIASFPPEEIWITAYLSAEDGMAYGRDIGTAIRRGGWEVVGNSINQATATDMDDLRGVAILHNEGPIPTKATELQLALGKAGLTVPILKSNSTSSGSVVLWIGRR